MQDRPTEKHSARNRGPHATTTLFILYARTGGRLQDCGRKREIESSGLSGCRDLPMLLSGFRWGVLTAPGAPGRGVAQPGSAPGSGPGGRRFKSSRPDHSFQGVIRASGFPAHSTVGDFVGGLALAASRSRLRLRELTCKSCIAAQATARRPAPPAGALVHHWVRCRPRDWHLLHSGECHRVPRQLLPLPQAPRHFAGRRERARFLSDANLRQGRSPGTGPRCSRTRQHNRGGFLVPVVFDHLSGPHDRHPLDLPARHTARSQLRHGQSRPRRRKCRFSLFLWLSVLAFGYYIALYQGF